MGRWNVLLAMAMILTVASGGMAASGQERFLKLPVTPLSEEIHGLPLTSALTNLGARLVGGYVTFGTEVLLIDGKEPMIFLPRKPAGTLGSNLHEVFRQLPGYDLRFVPPRLFEILPSRGKKAPNDLLEIRVKNFSLTNKPATSVLAYPERFIPELEATFSAEHPLPPNGIQVFSGPYEIPSSRVTIQLQNVTVRQILEAVVTETERIPADSQPPGWALLVNSDDTPGVPRHCWQLLSGVPGDWRKYRNLGNPGK